MFRQIQTFLTKHKEFLTALFTSKPIHPVEPELISEVVSKVVIFMHKENDNG
jgi:hypothetical protein